MIICSRQSRQKSTNLLNHYYLTTTQQLQTPNNKNMAYEFYDAEVIRVEDESDVVKRFWIKMPDALNFSFKAAISAGIFLPTAFRNLSASSQV